MHSEFTRGLTLRPLMDAGYTAWRNEERVGIVRLVDGEIVVGASDPAAREVLVERLSEDLRLIGLPVCVSSSQVGPGRSDVRSSGSSWMQDTKSAA